MRLARPLLERTYLCLALFASFHVAFAVPQNVTIDDAASNGTVVPQYLPADSLWSQGNDCPDCLAKPDPSQAYNGTWHDATYKPRRGTKQGIEFTFTGNAVYIFFILANNVTGANTLTDLVFTLNEDIVGSFVHSPSASTDYQYNVPVYANDSLGFGQYTMTIEPVNSGNAVLMLFDYLIYTTDPDLTTTMTATTTTGATAAPSSTTPSSSSSAPGVHSPSSRQNIAAIVGGSVGGASAIALVIASLLCCWRRKKRRAHRLRSPEPVLGSLISLHEPFEGTVSPFPNTDPPLYEEASEIPTLSSVPRPLSMSVSINPPSTASVDSRDAGLRAEVEILRGEIAHLRNVRSYDQKIG